MNGSIVVVVDVCVECFEMVREEFDVVVVMV